MSNPFFDHPILNSPYAYPTRHWELDEHGQPTQKILEIRRRAEFITPIPKPKKRKRAAAQEAFVFDEGKGLSTKEQQYDPTSIIREVRSQVDVWRSLPNPINGRSRRRQLVFFSIGVITSLAVFAHSSARSRRRRPPSGSPKWRPNPRTGSACLSILCQRTGMPIRN